MDKKIIGFEIIKRLQDLIILISDIEIHRITYNKDLHDETIKIYKDMIINSVECL